MFTVSAGMSLAKAERYFLREDYLLKDVTSWVGRGANALGLADPVRKQDFYALCKGQDPMIGARLVSHKVTKDKSGKRIEAHRAGHDLVFSAPKSVSIAYAAGVAETKEAHDAAVLSLTEHLERDYSHYRSPGGILKGGLLAARFDHATSENLDPLLHTHLFLMNAVLIENGGWRANAPKAIFQDQKCIGLLYRQRLAYELVRRGFEIAVKDQTSLFFELQEIDPGLIGYFSSRRREIKSTVAMWEARGKFPGVRSRKLYEMAMLETMSPRRQISRRDVIQHFDKGFSVCGTSSIEVKRLVTKSLAIRPSPLRPSPF